MSIWIHVKTIGNPSVSCSGRWPNKTKTWWFPENHQNRWLQWHLRTWRSMGVLRLRVCYFLKSAAPPWKPLGILAFPVPRPVAERCAPKTHWMPLRISDGYRKTFKTIGYSDILTAPRCWRLDRYPRTAAQNSSRSKDHQRCPLEIVWKPLVFIWVLRYLET